MDILKVKQNGEWVGIPAIKGDKGEKGDTGEQGQNGADGFSPTASVSKSGSAATITITDKNGTTSATVSDGAALIDDTAGAGDTDKAWSADKTASELGDVFGAINQKYEKPVTGIPASDLASGVIPAVPVQDVQVNGVSVLNQGVANVPPLAINSYGAAKVGTSSESGLELASNGILRVSYASGNEIKSGSASARKPIIPYNQHESTFYGLAKAAGADMASVSGATVGVYPEAQQNAICNMIGTERKMRLLKTIDITTETGVIGFDTDLNGLPFKVDKIVAYVYMKKASLDSKDLTFGIETTAIVSNGANWVGKVVNFSSTTSGAVAKITVERDNFRWTLSSQVDKTSSDDFFNSVWTSSGSVLGRLYLNGASWIRANNPLYATQLSVCISEIVFPVGTRFEFYAHDYQG